jgi:hypothetical protein
MLPEGKEEEEEEEGKKGLFFFIRRSYRAAGISLYLYSMCVYYIVRDDGVYFNQFKVGARRRGN